MASSIPIGFGEEIRQPRIADAAELRQLTTKSRLWFVGRGNQFLKLGE